MHDRQLLYVLRHAKSSWDEPGLDDHDRPLAPRGRDAAEAMAEYLRAEGIRPELVICSSARRARETLDGVDPAGRRLVEPAVYSASATDLLQRLRRVPDGIASVMVIGHNPTLQMLVLCLANPAGAALSEGSDLEAVRGKFPTGAIATLQFDGGWSELEPGRAVLSGFVRPRQLS
jgi:phosphohistidine phosphatase